ncbi:hypothetical protein BLA60_31150 [Actinophytocola xinjiangensis]|uniref:Acyl-CoA dehydrogenase n=1 Tax=Actinophytocola xinjiangensis TaxID=485602 RepID=A0A7Z0WHN3_9PSEU|nr:acyl-CoA dehydrogenase family protein [Actinophytocola xinjiangensis]OLF06434.1 hypothetical protein BLA60_31150 [Actinophytocola xinjiangensis]
MTPTDEHRQLAASLHDLLSDTDTAALTRDWAAGEHAAGLALLARLADLGACGLAVPTRFGGLGAGAVELAVVFETLGRHAVPGPLVESFAVVPAVVAALPVAAGLLPRLVAGELATVALPALPVLPPWPPAPGDHVTDGPRQFPALDGAAVDNGEQLAAGTDSRALPGPGHGDPPVFQSTDQGRQFPATNKTPVDNRERPTMAPIPQFPGSGRGDPPVFQSSGGHRQFSSGRPGAVDAGLAPDADVATPLLVIGSTVYTGLVGERSESVDPARRLFALTPGEALGPAGDGFGLGVVCVAARLLGLGHGMLDLACAHVRARRQFGRPVGEFQAVKHQLADVLVALEFARPLVFEAARTLAARDVSAAKVAAADAAYLAARTALQVHGALGYTQEYDLARRLLAVRALREAWGTRSWHRARVLDALTAPASR